jgi:hypothetical protein
MILETAFVMEYMTVCQTLAFTSPRSWRRNEAYSARAYAWSRIGIAFIVCMAMPDTLHILYNRLNFKSSASRVRRPLRQLPHRPNGCHAVQCAQYWCTQHDRDILRFSLNTNPLANQSSGRKTTLPIALPHGAVLCMYQTLFVNNALHDQQSSTIKHSFSLLLSTVSSLLRHDKLHEILSTSSSVGSSDHERAKSEG